MNNQQMAIMREACIRMRSLEDAVVRLNRNLEELAGRSIVPTAPGWKRYVTISEAAASQHPATNHFRETHSPQRVGSIPPSI